MDSPPIDTLISALIHSLPLNVYAKNRDGIFIYANAYYCKNIGRKMGDLIGKNDFDVHPRELAEKYRMDDDRVMSTGRTESINEQWESLNGKHKMVTVIKAPLYAEGNNSELIGTIGVFWNTTKTHQAALALAEERNLLRTVIDKLPNFIYVKDRESRFIVANKAVSRVMGAKTPDELIGNTDFDYYPEEEAFKFRKDELEVIHSSNPITDLEECHHDSDGNEVWTQTSKMPFRNINGDIIGIIGTGKDITKRKEEELLRKRLEDQLRQSQKMETIGTLTAGIAHDFNNLLNVINGYSELMSLSMTHEDPAYQNLQKILQAGRSAAELINQLMAFSRKQVIQPQTVNFNELLGKTKRLLHRVLGEKIEIKLQLAENLWPINIDPNQMDQIIVNLATNARDAMADGGILLLKTENITINEDYLEQHRILDLETGDYIRFSVKDSGCGIEEDIRDRIFEPFFTTKEMHKGTGLGLSTIFGIVQQNNGTIQVESSVQSGSAFHILLPRCPEAQALYNEEESNRNLPKGSERILVVEDEKNVQELISEMLQDLGYSVSHASNGIEAMNLVSNNGHRTFDLLLTDVVMPVMGGKELADNIIKFYPNIKILFMSGYTDDVISQKKLGQPGMAFIQKPVTPYALAQNLRNLLDRN